MGKHRKFHYTQKKKRKFTCEHCPHFIRRYPYPEADGTYEYVMWCKKYPGQVWGWGCYGEDRVANPRSGVPHPEFLARHSEYAKNVQSGDDTNSK